MAELQLNWFSVCPDASAADCFTLTLKATYSAYLPRQCEGWFFRGPWTQRCCLQVLSEIRFVNWRTENRCITCITGFKKLKQKWSHIRYDLVKMAFFFAISTFKIIPCCHGNVNSGSDDWKTVHIIKHRQATFDLISPLGSIWEEHVRCVEVVYSERENVWWRYGVLLPCKPSTV